MATGKKHPIFKLHDYLYSVGIATQEAISASSLPQLTRAKESNSVKTKKMRESAVAHGAVPAKEGKRFSVILIKEGLGNLGDLYYYTREALQKAAKDKIFEGKKLYINHPSNSEEQDRPERDVRDIGGYFQNVTFAIDGDRSHLAGDLVVLDGAPFDLARTLIRESVKFSETHQSDLVGLSINANGDAEAMNFEEFAKTTTIPREVLPKLFKAREQGAELVRVVKEIKSAVSCDLVTEAGAGGRVVKMLEQENEMKKKLVESEEKKIEAPAVAIEPPPAVEPVPAVEEAPKPTEPAPTVEPTPVVDAAVKEADKPAEPADTDEQDDADLIKKMLDKHLGTGDHEEGDMEATKTAYHEAKAAGFKGEEAEKAACYSMKMAKHFAGKQKEAEETKETEEAKKEAAGTPVLPSPGVGGSKESDFISLTAENAKLRESLKSHEMRDALDKRLAATGWSRTYTDAFRKLVEGVKSVKEIDDKFQAFKEAKELGGESEGLGFVISQEKEEAGFSATKEITFADCKD